MNSDERLKELVDELVIVARMVLEERLNELTTEFLGARQEGDVDGGRLRLLEASLKVAAANRALEGYRSIAADLAIPGRALFTVMS